MGGFFSSNKSREEIEMVLAKPKDIVSSSPVIVYSKSYCPYCVRAKQLLTQLRATFKAIELDQESLTLPRVSIEKYRYYEYRLREEDKASVIAHAKGSHATNPNVMAKHSAGQLVPLLTEAGALAA